MMIVALHLALTMTPRQDGTGCKLQSRAPQFLLFQSFFQPGKLELYSMYIFQERPCVRDVRDASLSLKGLTRALFAKWAPKLRWGSWNKTLQAKAV